MEIAPSVVRRIGTRLSATMLLLSGCYGGVFDVDEDTGADSADESGSGHPSGPGGGDGTEGGDGTDDNGTNGSNGDVGDDGGPVRNSVYDARGAKMAS